MTSPCFRFWKLLGIALLCLSCGGEAPAELILVNGKVFTGETSQPFAEAIAIRGGRILSVGTTAEIKALSGSNTRRIDLAGRVVIPGINDAHYHSIFMPPFGHHLSFDSPEPSWDQTLDSVKEAIDQLSAGTWVFGTVGAAVFMDPDASRVALDRTAPDHPVYLATYYGHGDLINSKAMSALDISGEGPDPRGGRLERVTGSAQFNGRLLEYAQWVPRARLISKASDEDLVRVLQALGEQAVRYGITSIQDMPMLPLERYLGLLHKANLPLRVRAIRLPLINVGEQQTAGDLALSGPPW